VGLFDFKENWQFWFFLISEAKNFWFQFSGKNQNQRTASSGYFRNTKELAKFFKKIENQGCIPKPAF
jgi:hypothetical protein